MEKNITKWNGFKRIDFEFKGRKAIVVLPEEQNGKWMLKTEYFDAFPDFEIEMIKKGWTLAFVSNITRWCLDEDLDVKKEFADYIIEEYNLCKKCLPVGMSCGGMIAVKFAAKYPEYISALYIDAPVLNLLSCPADLGLAEGGMYEEFVEATGMTMSELICYREHPIDKIPALIENNIKIVMVYGKADNIVPYCENGAILEKYYKEHGGELIAIGKDGCGHHPHGLENPNDLVKIIEDMGV